MQCSAAASISEGSAVPQQRGEDRRAEGCPGEVTLTYRPTLVQKASRAIPCAVPKDVYIVIYLHLNVHNFMNTESDILGEAQSASVVLHVAGSSQSHVPKWTELPSCRPGQFKLHCSSATGVNGTKSALYKTMWKCTKRGRVCKWKQVKPWLLLWWGCLHIYFLIALSINWSSFFAFMSFSFSYEELEQIQTYSGSVKYEGYNHLPNGGSFLSLISYTSSFHILIT